MKIEKLLVANRGEIAVRIFRTCQELGISTVAVYSDADAESVHKKFADEAVRIGPAEAARSYLNIETLIQAAIQTGAQAIHPGYGFLSERVELAEACEQNGLIFIGPTVESMKLLGDKISAKKLAVQAKVPIVPGYFEPGASVESLLEAAERVGYPVMLKAAAGGGGRGIRLVETPEELVELAPLAAQEALNAFGDGEMMLEKLIRAPRHVEVQIAADQLGAVACLFERECSIQRRNQKMLEEAPSPAIESGLVDWVKLREAAASVARAANYLSLGTVEFIVDSTTGDFYFLEVNTRIQVEHPVTEAITGVDLVALQIRIAEGEPLDLPKALIDGDRKAISGHSIEVRILAEEPDQDFRPSVGKILLWRQADRPGIRIDSGFRTGSEVPPYYDSLLCKVISHGTNRLAAIEKLRSALEEIHILGVSTNIGFMLEILEDPVFVKGETTTAFFADFLNRRQPSPIPDELLAILNSSVNTEREPSRGTAQRSSHPAWDLQDGFRIGSR